MTCNIAARPGWALLRSVFIVAIAAIAAALFVAAFAAGYEKGYADAWHELYKQPTIVIRSSN